MPKGRPRTNSEELIFILYTELAMSIDEIARLTNYNPRTIKVKLQDRKVYDPPVTEYFIKQIWSDWQQACNRIKNANCRGTGKRRDKNADD